jgi:Ca2+-binding EF-hand superfamily protein
MVNLASLVCLCFFCNSLHIHSQSLDGPPEPGSWNTALEKFFGSIDKDGDGQIEASEATQYIDANFDVSDIHVDASNAAQQMSRNLDGSDSDATISKEEVEGHLRRLQKVHSG